jgi:hypothetical protein
MTWIEALTLARMLIKAGGEIMEIAERAAEDKRDLTPDELAAVEVRNDEAMQRLRDRLS